MASSITEILLVILLIHAKVHRGSAIAQDTTLDAPPSNASALNASDSNASPSNASALNASALNASALRASDSNATTLEFQATTTSPSECPDLCVCKESEKRDGITVDCMDRKLVSVPESIPEGTIYVNLKKNLIRSLTNASFAKWNKKRIQKINLSQNNISHVEKYAFKNFNHIWVIDLSYNNLTHVNKVRFPATHELNLEGNPMRLKPMSGFQESVFKSTRSSVGDCYAIYRRLKTSQMDEHWKYLEHVNHVIANIKCAPEPFLKRTPAAATNQTITPQNNLTVALESNETNTTPENNLSNTPQSKEDRTRQENLTSSVLLQSNATLRPNGNMEVEDNFLRINNTGTIVYNEIKEIPKPTIYEAFFYGSLLVIFSLLILFLISQKYNHVCYKSMRTKFCGKKTRRTTVNGHIIHVHPLQRKQSHKPN